jgi:hypothetical protein
MLRTAGGSIGANDEFISREQIGTGAAIAQVQANQPRQGRLTLPGVTPRYGAICRDAAKVE